MLSTLATIYVTYVEPALLLAPVLLAGLLLLYGIAMLKDGGKSAGLVVALTNGVFKGVVALVKGIGLALLWVATTLQKAIKVIFAAVTDFFGGSRT